MNKREVLLDLVYGQEPPEYVPAAFFLHFDPEYHQGQAAVARHLEFFRYTGMDLVKVQYEQRPPAWGPPARPEAWAGAPRVEAGFFEPTVSAVRGLVEAAGREALVIVTLYSPYMWARQMAGEEVLNRHLRENPQAVARGLEALTENVLDLARGCIEAGADGFYVSTQGGEATRFGGTAIFSGAIRPSDLAVWEGIEACRFNVLHVCDYEGGYEDLSPFLDYPGHAVNCSLEVGERRMTPAEAGALFGRPFMGGLERKGAIASGGPGEIVRAVEAVLEGAPERFILAADCTVPGGTPWENLRTAIERAHQGR